MLKTTAAAALILLLSSCSAIEPDNTSDVCASARSEVVTMMNVLTTVSNITTQAGMEPVVSRLDEGGSTLVELSKTATNDEILELVSTLGSSFKSFAADNRVTMYGDVDDERSQVVYSKLMISVADIGARCDWPDF